MRKLKFKSVLSLMLIFLVVLSMPMQIFAASYSPNLQVYFNPHIMNDQTGEITVDVNIRNYASSVPASFGSICNVGFSAVYDADHFDVKLDEESAPLVVVNDDTMVKYFSDIDVVYNKEEAKLTFNFLDSTLKDNLIKKDGTLFSFVLIAKEPKRFWNSFDKYPLRFVEDTVVVMAYSDKDEVSRLYNAEGIDAYIGSYNNTPTFDSQKINKKLVFTVGESDVKVNELTVKTDAVPFINKDTDDVMLPVRYLTENTDMTVEWYGDIMVAAAYGEAKTVKVNMKTNSIFVNSVKIYNNDGSVVKPAEVNDRIYVPVSIMERVYPGCTVEKTDDVITISIP